MSLWHRQCVIVVVQVAQEQEIRAQIKINELQARSGQLKEDFSNVKGHLEKETARFPVVEEQLVGQMD